ncbi:MAG: 7-carboxy-7-deazaguanine synthase QueE [Gammaproteobacteria bacterium]|nr:7-carboxy-7-deazaguanine synthase QueE [Gammaproteobacteria bacterium]
MQRDFSSSLRITEIFYSIQGESSTVGWPTVFIRLTGCPLRCNYCDTTYAFHGGKITTIANIISTTEYYFINNKSGLNKYVTVTGGEPLAQPGCASLISRLCELGYNVSLETSGAFCIKDLDSRLMIVMDLKTPGSQEADKNLWQNLEYLKPKDQIKFVICSLEDYAWAKQVIINHDLVNKCEILFSPSYKQIKIRDLAEAILVDRLSVRLQAQLHKYIWGDEPGR